jgi:hypothetical protein
MDNQQANRRSAAREFMRSLAELETVLQPNEPSLPAPDKTPAPAPSEDFDWESALGEAAQDIEQLMDTESDGGAQD